MMKFKSLTKALKFYEGLGWHLARQKRHRIYKHPKGGTVVVSQSSSDRDSVRRVVNDFNREGQRISI